MRLFRYRAVDPYGEPLEGTMEEASAARVTSILQERGAQVNDVLEIGKPARRHGAKKRLGWAEVALLNDQLLSIIKGKIPVAPSVQAMAKDLDNRQLKPVLDHLRSDLEAGRSLEEAFQRSPRAFPPIYLSLIRAGERSGDLTGVLQMITGYSTRILDMRDRVLMALVYPSFVVVATLLALFNILLRVVPQYESIFKEFGGLLPAPTRLLVSISHFFVRYPVQIAGGTLLVIALMFITRLRLRGSDFGGVFLDKVREHAPVVGRTFRTASLARFSKALGLMLEAGVPIGESLDLAGAAAANDHLRVKVRSAAVHIAQGDRVADALSDTRYFPHSYLWFLANGESRGQLPRTLIELSEASEREISVRDEVMASLIAPVTIVTLGGFVLFVVVSLYLPIFTLGDALTGR